MPGITINRHLRKLNTLNTYIDYIIFIRMHMCSTLLSGLPIGTVDNNIPVETTSVKLVVIYFVRINNHRRILVFYNTCK